MKFRLHCHLIMRGLIRRKDFRIEGTVGAETLAERNMEINHCSRVLSKPRI
jgi:hypothetical protein